MQVQQLAKRDASNQEKQAFAPAHKKTKCEEGTSYQWQLLQEYTKKTEDAYFLKYLVKSATKLDETADKRFETLFHSMKEHLFGTDKFFSSELPTYIAQDYIETEKKIRDFDLLLFWKHLRNENPNLNLPPFTYPNEIRDYFQTDPKKVARITVLKMNGILDCWEAWHKAYGESHGLPYFDNEKEIHAYLENDNNKPVLFAIISKERDTILEKTTRLPPEIKHLVGLKHLTLSNRKASVVPKAMYELSELRELNINHSELKKLSRRVGYLWQLQKLSITGSSLAGLPKELAWWPISDITIEDKILDSQKIAGFLAKIKQQQRMAFHWV